MIKVFYNNDLKYEYKQLFAKCIVNPARVPIADLKARQINANKARYEAIAKGIGCPWFVVGVIHLMECGLRFDAHLHNGDSLKEKTKMVPKGRPCVGLPPYDFEHSADDALRLLNYDKWKDWSIEGILWKLENYNGLGYRQYHPGVKSPYLWSFTNHYTRGKYVADGKWSSETVSQQLGVAAVLKRMVELGFIKL